MSTTQKNTKHILIVSLSVLLVYFSISFTLKPRQPSYLNLNEKADTSQGLNDNSSYPKALKHTTVLRGNDYAIDKNEQELLIDDQDQAADTETTVENIAQLETSILNSVEADINIGIAAFMQLRDAYIAENRLDDYQTFLESLPASYEFKVEALSELARFYAENNDFDKAYDLMTDLQTAQPDNDRLTYYLSDIYRLQGLTSEAISQYLAFLDLKEDSYHYYQLGQIFNDMGQDKLAAQFIDRAKELSIPSFNENGESEYN